MARHELDSRQTLQDALDQTQTKQSFGVAFVEAALRESLNQSEDGEGVTREGTMITLSPKVEVEVFRRERELEALEIVALCIRISVVFDSSRVSVTDCHVMGTAC